MTDYWYEMTDWMTVNDSHNQVRIVRGPAGEAAGCVSMIAHRTGLFRASVYIDQTRIFVGYYKSPKAAKTSITSRLVRTVNTTKEAAR